MNGNGNGSLYGKVFKTASPETVRNVAIAIKKTTKGHYQGDTVPASFNWDVVEIILVALLFGYLLYVIHTVVLIIIYDKCVKGKARVTVESQDTSENIHMQNVDDTDLSREVDTNSITPNLPGKSVGVDATDGNTELIRSNDLLLDSNQKTTERHGFLGRLRRIFQRLFRTHIPEYSGRQGCDGIFEA